MGADFYWTDDAVADMRRMLKEGSSFSQIAVAIGCPSRNAVIGKARRVGVAPGRKKVDNTKVSPAATERKGPARNVPKRAQPASLPPLVLVPTPSPDGGVLFLERGHFQCAMPAAGWDEAHITEKRCCGAATTALTSYCRACEAIVYAPARQRDPVTRQVTRGIAA